MERQDPGTVKAVSGVAIAIAAIVVIMAWTMGDPPATSVFWPEQQVEVVDFEHRSYGPGRLNPFLLVTARTADGQTGTLEVVDRFQRDANGLIAYEEVDGRRRPIPDLAPGDQLTARVGGGGMTIGGAGLGLIFAVVATIIGSIIAVGAIVVARRAGRRQEPRYAPRHNLGGTGPSPDETRDNREDHP